MGNVVTGSYGGLVYANSNQGAISLNTATVGPVTRPDSFHDQAAQSTAEGTVLEVGNLLTGGLIGIGLNGAVSAQSAVRNYLASRGVVASDDAVAIISNNFYRDGAPPELIQQTFDLAARSSTHNPSSAEVVLGRYISGSENSYEVVAQVRGSSYFSMSDWAAVQGQLGAEKMWSINKAFLDQQMSQGKTFIFTANPASAPTGSFTNLEMTHILNSGYKIQPTSGGFFNAVKK